MPPDSLPHQVIIVNAGAISPLVNLLSVGVLEVKKEVSRALMNLSLRSLSTQLAIAASLVGLLGTGTAEAQEHVGLLLLTLADDADNLAAISKTGAIRGLVLQMKGNDKHTSVKAQELAADVLRSYVACALSVLASGNRKIQEKVAAAGGVEPLVRLLDEPTASRAKEEVMASDGI